MQNILFELRKRSGSVDVGTEMAITEAQVGWGSYLDYEGPWTRGVHRMPEINATASIEEKTVAVIAATEGAAFDAVNMYDRCVLTVGCIQFCDGGQFSVCEMLGEVAQRTPNALAGLARYVQKRGYSFEKTPRGRWRFQGPNGEVDTVDEQRGLYLNGCSGRRGTWDDESRAWARGLVVAVASVWDDADARDAQLRFTYRSLPGFVVGSGKGLFTNAFGASVGLSAPEFEAARAAYFSFAANLPGIASKHFGTWCTSANQQRIRGRAFLVGMLRALTFGPRIAIYPGRYDRIAPVLARLWGIDLPHRAKELERIQVEPLETIRDVSALQAALQTLGFDLGPHASDGVYGPKTRAAVVQFQALNGLVPDGIVGPKTTSALIAALTSRRAAAPSTDPNTNPGHG